MNKKQIAHSFGQATQTYDEQAPVQKWTAQQLRQYVGKLDLPENIRILEIGCGTGFLTSQLHEEFPRADWVITDISMNMLEKCRDQVGDIGVFKEMDGEHPDLTEGFDLIVSNLALQWFQDLPKGLARLAKLLNPKGHLIFHTLGQNTFKEWSDALSHFGLESGVHRYPSFEGLKDTSFDQYAFSLHRTHLSQPYKNALAFLRALKLIGANEPVTGYQTLTPGKLRQVLKHIDQGECLMTYDVLLGHISKE